MLTVTKLQKGEAGLRSSVLKISTSPEVGEYLVFVSYVLQFPKLTSPFLNVFPIKGKDNVGSKFANYFHD